MNATIKIGADQDTLHHAKPLTHLPARLDRETCITLLAQADCFLTEEGIKAGKQFVTMESIDDLFELGSLGMEDRFRFKQALVGHGLLIAGKRVGA
jgi:hypothetical protein